jgi:hypothetical protein
MSSAAHRAQTPPADRASIAALPRVPVASPAIAAAVRVPRTRTGGPGFAVGAAASLFAVLVAFVLFAVLLALML